VDPAIAEARRREREAWVVLMSVPGLGPVTFTALIGSCGSAVRVLDVAGGSDGEQRLLDAMADRTTESEDGAARRMIGLDLARRIRARADDPEPALRPVRELGLEVLILEDRDYPWRLRAIEEPPPLLFVRGAASALSAPHAVAVCLPRPTDRGRLVAGWIASGLARAGAVVVSGLAVGIDGAAHAAVVAEGQPTVAVLGGGHARLFPRAHERLANEIVAAGGAVVAELTPNTTPSKGTFPRRNRLVSGLSDATIVVEAGRRSGALITAGWAMEQGRECLLVPGPLDSPTSEGCNAFLRCFPGQTRVVCGIPELLEDLGLAEDAGIEAPVGGRNLRGRPVSSAPAAGREAALAALGPVERLLAEALANGPATADDLTRRSALPGATVLSALTLLELRGLVTSAYGRYSPAGSLTCWSPRRQELGDCQPRRRRVKEPERA
jgi:DNA processing protein